MPSTVRRNIFLLFLSLPVFAAPSIPGISDFYRVNEHVYRGAQPSEEGFNYLAKIGVKTVLDLRENDSRTPGERRMVSAAGMEYVNIPMTGLTPPTETEISGILRLLEDETGGPVFVHCKAGHDRTGAVIAAYRIDHDGWDNQRALKEAMANGMSYFQFPRQNYIKTFRARTVEAKASSKPAATTGGDALALDAKNTEAATAAAAQ
jgi:protein tyrosine phosphatase (PTP) superfamily phosphohydrolase (DUF442 family)